MLSPRDRRTMKAWSRIIAAKLREWRDEPRRGTAEWCQTRALKVLQGAGFGGSTLFGVLRFLRCRLCPVCGAVIGPSTRAAAIQMNVSHLISAHTCSAACAGAKRYVASQQNSDEPSAEFVAEIEARKDAMRAVKEAAGPPPSQSAPYEIPVCPTPTSNWERYQ